MSKQALMYTHKDDDDKKIKENMVISRGLSPFKDKHPWWAPTNCSDRDDCSILRKVKVSVVLHETYHDNECETYFILPASPKTPDIIQLSLENIRRQLLKYIIQKKEYRLCQNPIKEYSQEIYYNIFNVEKIAMKFAYNNENTFSKGILPPIPYTEINISNIHKPVDDTMDVYNMAYSNDLFRLVLEIGILFYGT